MMWRRIAVLVGCAVVGSLGVTLWATGSTTAENGCDTTLAQAASAGAGSVEVNNSTGCDYLDWIVINQGGDTEECLQLHDPSGLTLLLIGTLANGHDAGENVDEVQACPTPTLEPTPEPTPEPTETPTSGPQCGTYGELGPWPEAMVILIPDGGPAGSLFAVELASVEPNGFSEQPTEVLWDWDPGSEGHLIGSGAVPQHEAWAMIGAMVPEDAEPGEHRVTACWWYSLNETWYYKDAEFHVGEPEPTPEPTPTYEPTPTPTPTAGEMHNCPEAGKWSIAVWEGADEAETGEALAACGEGEVDAAYYLDPESQQWRRWFFGLPELSNLLTLKDKEGMVAHGRVTPPPTEPTPTPTPSPADGPGQMRNCPQAGKWGIAVWDGPEGADIGEALASCEEEVDYAYHLDPESQVWWRWFLDMPEVSNLQTLKEKQGFFAHGKATLGPVASIAFSSIRDGNLEIYVMNPDGTGQTRLTNDPGWDDYPAWSPDRSKIAFASDRDGNNEIYVMSADGSGQTRLTNDSANDFWPAWSPDGSKIAFASDRDGNNEIYVMSADGSGQTRLTYSAPAAAFDPAWSPDGGKIAFAQTDADGDTEIYVMNADGTGQTKLTSNTAYDEDPTWSPDSSLIAFTSLRDGNWDIYGMNADGTGQTRLTSNSNVDRDPSWSPDGARIAFISDRDGNVEIYAMKTNGSGQTNLTINPKDDWRPAWSP